MSGDVVTGDSGGLLDGDSNGLPAGASGGSLPGECGDGATGESGGLLPGDSGTVTTGEFRGFFTGDSGDSSHRESGGTSVDDSRVFPEVSVGFWAGGEGHNRGDPLVHSPALPTPLSYPLRLGGRTGFPEGASGQGPSRPATRVGDTTGRPSHRTACDPLSHTTVDPGRPAVTPDDP